VKRPDLPTIKYHYAMALAQNGNKDEARKVLKRLAGADFPEKAEAHALLAELGG
jgi:predicted Zn-dependent protease